jgi:predicted dehydrogenase
VVEYAGGLVEAFGGPQGAEQQMEIRPPAFDDVTNPLNQHRAFLEAAREGKAAPVSVASGVRDMRVVEALYRSAGSGKAVEV